MPLVRRLLGAMLLIATPVAALYFMAWPYAFYPERRIEVQGPAGAAHRAFTHNVSFQDLDVVICVADWPATLWRPLTLGSVVSEPPWESGNAYWSVDGSVLALHFKKNAADLGLFGSAYDFRARRQIVNFDRTAADREISALMVSRGGIGPLVTGIDYGKGDNDEPYARFPLWPWLVSLPILAVGWTAAYLLIRRRRT